MGSLICKYQNKDESNIDYNTKEEPKEIHSNKDKIKKIILIQSTFKSYLKRKRISSLFIKRKERLIKTYTTRINNSHTNKDKDKDESEFESYFNKINDQLGTLSIDNNELTEYISIFYMNFFDMNQIDTEKMNTKEVYLTYELLNVKNGEEFISKNKLLLLIFIDKLNIFDLSFISKPSKNSNNSNNINNYKSDDISNENSLLISSQKNSRNGNFEKLNTFFFNDNTSNIINTLKPRRDDVEYESIYKSNHYKSSVQSSKLENNKSYTASPIIVRSTSNFMMKSLLVPLIIENESSSTVSDMKIKPFLTHILSKFNRNDDDLIEKVEKNSKIHTFYRGFTIKSNNKYHGLGKYYYIKEGVRYKYKGYFMNGEFHGIGILISTNQYLYQGEFRNGKRCGYGIEVQNGKFSYKGLFFNDKYNGYGTYFRTDKHAVYYGNFKNGVKEGLGYLEFSDGTYYAGTFSNNKRSGKGLIQWNESQFYFGGWRNDVMEGYGSYRFVNGDLYKGGYVNNLKHGEGRYYFKSGASLKGRWENGKKEGVFLYSKNGKQTEEVYRNNFQL